jgi:hypothetical protein
VSTAPEPDLVAKDQKPARPATPDGTPGDDTPLFAAQVRDGRLFDDVCPFRYFDLEGGVIEVASRTPLDPRSQRLIDATVEPDEVPARAEGQPVQVDRRHLSIMPPGNATVRRYQRPHRPHRRSHPALSGSARSAEAVGDNNGQRTLRLPGDEVVAEPQWTYNHAISIDALRSAVWPWLVGLGQGRAGFYTYEGLENLVGCQIRNVIRIRSENASNDQGAGRGPGW